MSNTATKVLLNCRHFRLRPAALDLLTEKRTGVDFLHAALDRHMYQDALDFIAQWLPKRQVVWWGCLCGWQVLRQDTPKATTIALRAAVQWVVDPSEENRRHAEAAGYAADFATPAGNLALAAFHSGNIAPTGLPDVKPAPGLTNAIVANAITLLLVRVAPDQKEAVQEQFVRLALELDEGRLIWPQVNTTEPRPACHK